MLAVTGGKGGVGKTTTALGTARAVAQAGRRPVVVDADLDLPNLAAMAGVEPDGLGVVSAGAPLAAAPTIGGVTVLGTQPGTPPTTLQQVLDRLATTDRPVLVDCPAGAGMPHGIALRAATDSLVVTRPRECALADALKSSVLARRLDAPPTATVFNETTSVPVVASKLDVSSPVAVPSHGTQSVTTVDTTAYQPLRDAV
ncbi:MinD/ParA family ATP-binding protein [Halorarius litoreus]|uniref:MinD/ParA family ATP-binding protein n=1 Tax=Halorarius litoreus TaxID=2962676 RepID=UPI0020CC03BD|nr:P-loop NTPase [Halorarius litoreus]